MSGNKAALLYVCLVPTRSMAGLHIELCTVIYQGYPRESLRIILIKPVTGDIFHEHIINEIIAESIKLTDAGVVHDSYGPISSMPTNPTPVPPLTPPHYAVYAPGGEASRYSCIWLHNL